MKKVSFLIMLFLLFFSLLNFYIIPLVKTLTLKESFAVLFSFWMVIIVILFLVSNKLSKEDAQTTGEEDV